MLFNRMIVHNVERESLTEAARFIYRLTKDDDEEVGANHFGASQIKLLENGWVKVTRHDTGIECFPPSRVVALESSPIIHAVPDRESHG